MYETSSRLLSQMEPLSRAVTVWILETWRQELKSAGHLTYKDFAAGYSYVHVVPDGPHPTLPLEMIFRGTITHVGEDELPYNDLMWARVNNAFDLDLKPRMLNAIAWFSGVRDIFTGTMSNIFAGSTQGQLCILSEPMIALAPLRRMRLYDDLYRLLLVEEVMASVCCDCRRLVRLLLGQMAWDS